MNIYTMQIEAAEHTLARARGTYAKRLARGQLISALTDAVLDRDGPKCRYCGVETVLQGPHYCRRTVDHIQPVSQGGPDTMENLVIACANCNSRRGNRPVRAFARVPS